MNIFYYHSPISGLFLNQLKIDCVIYDRVRKVPQVDGHALNVSSYPLIKHPIATPFLPAYWRLRKFYSRNFKAVKVNVVYIPQSGSYKTFLLIDLLKPNKVVFYEEGWAAFVQKNFRQSYFKKIISRLIHFTLLIRTPSYKFDTFGVDSEYLKVSNGAFAHCPNASRIKVDPYDESHEIVSENSFILVCESQFFLPSSMFIESLNRLDSIPHRVFVKFHPTNDEPFIAEVIKFFNTRSLTAVILPEDYILEKGIFSGKYKSQSITFVGYKSSLIEYAKLEDINIMQLVVSQWD